jgi:hypothetical protein
MKIWKYWKYKNLTLFFLSIIIAFILTRFDQIQALLLQLGSYGYFGAFLAGILFVSTFTVAIGVIILSALTAYLSPLEIGLLAGLGAVVGDLIIFQFIKDNVFDEVLDLYKNIGGNYLSKLLHTKYFSWTLPVLGAAIIASPLPDELGVSLLGISRMKTYKFILLSFLLNFIGIFLVITLAETIK